METDENWSRPRWKPNGGKPFLYLVAVGVTEVSSAVPAIEYRTRGLPDGIEARSFVRGQPKRYLESFQEGYVWEQLVAEDFELSRRVLEAPGAIVLAGETDDSDSLRYLRDVMGVMAWLADHGAVAIHDPMTFRWWRPEQWKETFFVPDAPNPHRHVMILYSVERDGIWLHTRGLLAFGRPDLSIRGVASADFDEVADLCNELIERQAFGAVFREGQVVHDTVLGDFVIHHEGDRDDPEFNNAHVELLRQGS
ncbi:MAG: hypothetical protein JOZ54_13435 [Acidobacteria bacterium]|nr:hypothetical protein [Acidobacteriota bacterium]